MQTTHEGAERSAPPAGRAPGKGNPAMLLKDVLAILDDAKAESIVTIDLKGKSSIGDHMVIASGRSQRHVGAIADQIVKKLKDLRYGRARIEGTPHCDWVLIDTGDVIIHVFRPEVRDFYNLEKMWSADRPDEVLAS
jgi:ribosome-associated protein